MTLIYLFNFYFVIGFFFSLWFCFFKVTKIDLGASDASVWFKLIIIPAAILLWPIVWQKLYNKK